MEGLFKNKYRVKSTRLPEWDYSNNGYYFITICAKNKERYFGNVINDKMELSEIGMIVYNYWQEIPHHFPFVILDEFTVMPNHLHGIVIINKNEANNINNTVETRHCLVSTTDIHRARFQNQGKNTISSIIGSYKSICTKIINKNQNKNPFAWQPRFYDHIIRNEESLNKIREYIAINPLNWEKDRNNPENLYM